jgi:hypothetical protein
MNKVDIDKIKKLKGHADFYKGMIEEFYKSAAECWEGDEDILYDFFYNDFITFEELIEHVEIDKEVIELVKECEHEDGSATYSFDYTQEFVDRVSNSTGIENPTEQDVKDFLLNIFKDLEKKDDQVL